MKTLQLVLAALIISLASATAQAVPFMSGLDDTCRQGSASCNLSDRVAGAYVNPTGTALDGAAWVQNTSSWSKRDTYRIWEEDLSMTGTTTLIDSLFVSYDDRLQIKSQGVTLFDSEDYSINRPWNKIINVFDYVNAPFLIAGDGRLNFWVTNTGGPTGVIWKGSTVVPEPGTLALLGLGLIGLTFARRRAA